MMLTSTQIGELAAQFFIAGAGTLSFAVLFGCPRKSLPFCGLVGAVGWFVYELALNTLTLPNFVTPVNIANLI